MLCALLCVRIKREKMNPKNSMISIALASMLIGCGSSSSTPTPTMSKVCLDVNMNAICDAGETFKEVTTWDGNGDSKIEVDTSLTGAPLAYNGTNGYIFTAPAGSEFIYAGTTMKNNELIYNQVIEEKTGAAAKAYVHPHFAGGNPTAQNKKDIADAVKTNIEAYPNESRYAVIAAVMNKLFAASSVPADIAGITVTAEDIASADVPSLAKLNVTKTFDVNTSDAITTMDNAGWLDAGDTELKYLAAKNGKLVGGTVEHNGLAVVDVSEQSLKFTAVSVLTDAGDEVDSQSGASEAAIKGLELSSDGLSVYINVPRNDGNVDQNNLGLFKVAINTDGSIPTTSTELDPGDGQRIIVDTTRKLVKDNISKFALTPDDSKVLILDEDDNLIVYDGDLAGEIVAVETDGFEAISVSNDTVFAVADTNITKLSLSTLTGTEQIELSFEPSQIMVNADGTKLVAFQDGDSKIAVIDLSNNSIKEAQIEMEADVAAVSPDFTKLALVGEDEDKVLIVNLTVPEPSIQSSYDVDYEAEAVAFVDNDNVAIAYNGRHIAILNIETTQKNNNLSSKLEQAKKELNEGAINNNRPLDMVLDDLTLSTKHEEIAISWESTLSTNYLKLPDGNVTRPSIGEEDITGVLTATLSASFRGNTQTDSKNFDVKIRKLVPTSSITKSIDIPDDFEKHGGYMAAGPDGLLASLFTVEKNDNKKGGVFIFKSDGDDFDFHVGNENNHTQFEEDGDGLAVAFIGTDQVLAVSSGGHIYRYTVNGANDMIQSQKISLGSEETFAAGFNDAKTKLAVLVEDASENHTSMVYNIAGDGTVSFDKNISMKKLNYEDKLAINDDASIVFSVSGDDENIVNAQEGATHTSFAAATEIKGMTYISGILYATDEDGVINSFPNGDLTSSTQTPAIHAGRIYTVSEADDKLFVFLYVKKGGDNDGGITILDKTTLEEVHYIPARGLRRGTVSSDGKSVYFFKRTKPKNMSYIELP